MTTVMSTHQLRSRRECLSRVPNSGRCVQSRYEMMNACQSSGMVSIVSWRVTPAPGSGASSAGGCDDVGTCANDGRVVAVVVEAAEEAEEEEEEDDMVVCFAWVICINVWKRGSVRREPRSGERKLESRRFDIV
jgi:hypothetical protein